MNNILRKFTSKGELYQWSQDEDGFEKVDQVRPASPDLNSRAIFMNLFDEITFQK